MTETEKNQLLLEIQFREMSANAVETNSRSTTMSTMIHGEMFSGMFNSCMHNTFGADKFKSTSRSKKVNCLNFKFFQLCVLLLEMISILVDFFRFLSLVVIQILNQ